VERNKRVVGITTLSFILRILLLGALGTDVTYIIIIPSVCRPYQCQNS